MSTRPVIPTDLTAAEREALAVFLANRNGTTVEAALELITKAEADAERSDVPR